MSFYRSVIEEILKKEEEHADDLSNMLATFDPEKAPATKLIMKSQIAV